MFLIGGCAPRSVWAARAFLATDFSTVAVGDTILISAALDTGDMRLNTVDGSILLQSGVDSIEVKDFSVADSVLTNWLKTPSLEERSKISFIGGTPGGFNQKDALLFKIVFQAKAEGQVIFEPADVKVYGNDGKATSMDVSDTPLKVTIGPRGTASEKNQWQEVISKDNEPPQNVSVAIGRDDSVFDGKKFMTISAIDRQSGIDHFEVAEGNQPAIRTGSTYVLRDQTESTLITVTAFDRAGNKSSIRLSPDVWWRKSIVWVGVCILLGGALFFALRHYQSLQKKNVRLSQ
jgi:hypothetical protein